jgi:hypothetical protein
MRRLIALPYRCILPQSREHLFHFGEGVWRSCSSLNNILEALEPDYWRLWIALLAIECPPRFIQLPCKSVDPLFLKVSRATKSCVRKLAPDC